MKLIQYEIRKALSSRFLIVFLLLLIALNTFLFMEPWSSDDMFIAGKLYRDTRPLYDFLYSANSDAYNEYIDWLTDVYGDEWQYSFVELNNDGIPGRFLPAAYQEVSALSNCYTFINILFPEILANREHIVETARRLGGVAYMEDDYYGMRMNLDIIKHYSVKPAILPAFATDENEGVFWVGNQNGWKHFFNYKWGNLFAILFSLLISSRIFPLENKASSLLYATPKGRCHTAVAKLTAAVLISAIISLLFSLLNIILTAWQYGLGGINASILSILQFSLSHLNLTIGQTILLFTLFQTFGVMCIAVVATALSYILKSNLASYLGSVVFLGLSYGYYLLMGKNYDIPVVFRTLPDVTLWTRPMWMFETYRAVNLFSYPLMLEWVCFFFWLLIIIALYVLTIMRSKKGVRLS
jgi:hypothetical protein